MSNKENLLLRIKAVQALDQLYYQKGEHLYSHRRVWRNHARRIFGINYTTYIIHKTNRCAFKKTKRCVLGKINFVSCIYRIYNT